MSAAQDGRARAIEAATRALVKTGGDSEEYCRASARIAIDAALASGGVVTREVAIHEREWGNAFFADWKRERARVERAEGALLNLLAAWEHCSASNVCDHCRETARQAYGLVGVSVPLEERTR